MGRKEERISKDKRMKEKPEGLRRGEIRKEREDSEGGQAFVFPILFHHSLTLCNGS